LIVNAIAKINLVKKLLLLFFVLCTPCIGMSQSIFGKWKTVDNETGQEKSIVEIYEENGEVFGKVVDILNSEDKDALCKKCDGDEYNTPVLGLVLIKQLKKIGKFYRGGTIFDPERGKTYRCRLAIDKSDPNILQVRGYISFLYASQYWLRVVE